MQKIDNSPKHISVFIKTLLENWNRQEPMFDNSKQFKQVSAPNQPDKLQIKWRGLNVED